MRSVLSQQTRVINDWCAANKLCINMEKVVDLPNTGHKTSAFVDPPSTSDQRPIANGNRHGRNKMAAIQRKGDRNGSNNKKREKSCFLHNPSIVKNKLQTKNAILIV
ncbi:hypothetical protein J6590_001471 [Homalodisca vitripennis]|nr:hypothetical protein J6590_001471 [Homalodisca vitripennis]